MADLVAEIVNRGPLHALRLVVVGHSDPTWWTIREDGDGVITVFVATEELAQRVRELCANG